MSGIKLKALNNKYFITVLVFFVFILFFDKTNVKNWVIEMRKNKRMEQEIKHYENEIVNVDRQLVQLRSNNDSLEKFAREQFYMKRDNEEIFIIED